MRFQAAWKTFKLPEKFKYLIYLEYNFVKQVEAVLETTLANNSVRPLSVANL